MAHTILNRTKRRKKRVSTNIVGTNERPRISVHRSNKYIYTQAIDDIGRKTLASCSSVSIKAEKGSKSDISKQVGLKLAELLKDKKVEKAVFDRGRYAYNGRVKVLAEGLREGGIII